MVGNPVAATPRRAVLVALGHAGGFPNTNAAVGPCLQGLPPTRATVCLGAGKAHVQLRPANRSVAPAGPQCWGPALV